MLVSGSQLPTPTLKVWESGSQQVVSVLLGAIDNGTERRVHLGHDNVAEAGYQGDCSHSRLELPGYGARCVGVEVRSQQARVRACLCASCALARMFA